MSEAKALKIWSIDSVKDKEGVFIKNQNDLTAIQVPKSVYNTIQKIDQLPEGLNHIFIDVLATAINKRRLEDITDSLNSWTESTLKSHHYPQCQTNRAFYKLLNTFHRQLCTKYLTEKEMDHLVQFFAKCPHGYDVGWLIRAHTELKPVIT